MCRYPILNVMKGALLGIMLISLTQLVADSLVQVITPREIMITAIEEAFYRIHLYARANGKLPETVADFLKRSGYANRTTGEWGHDLMYTIGDDGTVT